MILNASTSDLVRNNAIRLANSIRTKDDLAELATAANYEQVLFAIESLLTNTDMYFDDEILAFMDENSWRSFKALLMVYTLNMVNRNSQGGTTTTPAHDRNYMGASVQA